MTTTILTHLAAAWVGVILGVVLMCIAQTRSDDR
jgi:hypothetical protein